VRSGGAAAGGETGALEEEIEIAPHHHVRHHLDPRLRTGAIHEELVQRLQRQAALTDRPLIHRRHDRAFADPGDQLRKQVGGDDGEILLAIEFLDRAQHRQ